LLGGLGHERQVEGAGRGGEAGDTPTPRSEAEVPAYAFKPGRVLQLRKDFADKRENHECLV
jgi:hypothetical protein